MPHPRIILVLAAALTLGGSPLFARQTQAAPQEQIDKCLAVLNSDATQKDKADACRELARIGGHEAVGPLAGLLGDEKLSHMARYGLETNPDPSVDSALRESLPRLRGRLLAGVIGSLGVRHDAAAVPALAKLLFNSDSDVAQASARALGKIATPGAAKALQSGVNRVTGADQLAFCEGLFRCAEAFTASGRNGPAADIYDQLRGLALPHQVRAAAWRGAILCHKNGQALLLEALHSGDFALFAAGVRTAYELPGRDITLALAGVAEQIQGDKRVLLTQALGMRADPAALPILLSSAQTGEAAVRVAAIRALPQLGDPAAAPVLFQLLSDPEAEIAQAAQAALVGLPGKMIDDSILGRVAAKDDSSRQIQAIDLAARRRLVSAIPDLENAGASADSAVRSAALKALGGLAGQADLPALLDLLAKASSPELIEAAEQSVTETCIRAANPDACSEAIAATLPQMAAPQKCALLRTLTAVGGAKSLSLVREAVADPTPEVHATAIRALAGWNSPEAAPALFELSKTAENPTDKMLTLRGYLGFASHADLPESQRLEICQQAATLVQRDEEKKLLLSALGDINTPGAIALIQPFLSDASIREEACTAAVNLAEKLIKAGGANQAPQLVAALQTVAQATANSDLANRVRALLEKTNPQAKPQ